MIVCVCKEGDLCSPLGPFPLQVPPHPTPSFTRARLSISPFLHSYFYFLHSVLHSTRMFIFIPTLYNVSYSLIVISFTPFRHFLPIHHLPLYLEASFIIQCLYLLFPFSFNPLHSPLSEPLHCYHPFSFSVSLPTPFTRLHLSLS